MKIHATALVDAGARLGRDVEIGPYSVIGAGVELGDRSIVQSHVVIEGIVTIGPGNQIGHGSVIGAPPQDLSFSPDRKTGVQIGSDNVLREYCTIHRGSPEDTFTKIGDRNYLMVGAHLGHNCEIGSNVIIANNCLLAGQVQVDDGAFLGGGSTFHQHMRIGRLVMVQGSSAFGKDLPPFTMAAERNAVIGLNVLGLRRADFDSTQRDDVKAAFKLLYLSGHNISQALAEADKTGWGTLGQEFFAFVREAKKRGICPYREVEHR